MKRSFATMNECNGDEEDRDYPQRVRMRLNEESIRSDTPPMEPGLPEVRGGTMYLSGNLGIPIPTTEGARTFLMEISWRLTELQRDLIMLDDEEYEDELEEPEMVDDDFDSDVDVAEYVFCEGEQEEEDGNIPTLGNEGVAATVHPQGAGETTNYPEYRAARVLGHSTCLAEALRFLRESGGVSEEDEIYRLLHDKLLHPPP